MSLNNCSLMGRLCFEPEIKTTPSGVSVIRFQIACDRNYAPQGKERPTDFIDCVAWRQTAEFVRKYFHKGDMIALTGSIQTENFTDKDGNKRKSTVVSVNNVSFCGSKENGNNGFEKPESNLDVDTSDFEEIEGENSELPF